MRNLLFWALLLGVFTATTTWASLERAEALFSQKRFSAARAEYEKLLSSAENESKWKILHRLVECEVLSFRYLEAAQRLLSTPLPEDSIWKSRMLLLLADVEREFVKQYGYSRPQDEVKGNADLSKRTLAQWHEEIEKHYLQLNDLREVMIDLPLGGESYFLSTENVDTNRFPTLWDFAVLRWTDYLLNESPRRDSEVKPSPKGLIDKKFTTPIDKAQSVGERVAAIYESASSSTGPIRQTAAEAWMVERVKLPWERPSLFTQETQDPKLMESAAKRLKELSAEGSDPATKSIALQNAALLFQKIHQPKQAVILCKIVDKNWSQTEGAKRCADLRAEIEIPVIKLETTPTPPPAKDSLTITTRNVDSVFYRIYRTQLSELKKRQSQNNSNSHGYLRYLRESAIKSYLEDRPMHLGEIGIDYSADYEERVTTFSPPPLSAGLYVVIVSADQHFDPGRSLMKATLLNVTRMFLFGTAASMAGESSAGEENIFHLYTVDAISGAPVKNANIEVLKQSPTGKVTEEEKDSDKNGVTRFSSSTKGEHYSVSLDPVAIHKGSHAYWEGPLYYRFDAANDQQIFLDTDRLIYRPGSRIQLRVTCLKRAGDTLTYCPKDTPMDLLFTDPGGAQVTRRKLSTDTKGGQSLELEAPTGRLLGQYQIRVSGSKNTQASQSVRVEEYKAPEFEIKLEELPPLRYGRPSQLTGSAKYFFGGAVDSALIRYRIHRETFIPWYCWWWRWRNINPHRDVVATGDVRANASGVFSIPFTPQEDSLDKDIQNPLPSRFSIEIEARDSSGNTASLESRFVAGKDPYIVHIEMKERFIQQSTESAANVYLRTLNDRLLQGKGSYKIHRLSVPEDFPYPPEMKSSTQLTNPPLENLMSRVADGEEVAKGDFTSTPEGLALLTLPALGTGIYRFTVSANVGESLSETSIILPVLDGSGGASQLRLPAVSRGQRTSYEVGETAKVLLGSSEIPKQIYAEIRKGNEILELKILSGGIHSLSIPVTDKYRGGFSIRWFGVADFKIRSGTIDLEVPWSDRQLTLEIENSERVSPGETVNWKGKISDPKGSLPTNAQAIIRIYDRALDSFASQEWNWFQSLYPPNAPPTPLQLPLFTVQATPVPIERDWLEKTLGIIRSFYRTVTPTQPPHFRSSRNRYSRAYGVQAKQMAFGGSVEMLAAAPPAGDLGQSTELRVDFSPSAYFAPSLDISKGAFNISTRFPDSLTDWKMTALVFSSDGKGAFTTANIRSSKPVMLNLEIPRFLREKDRGILRTRLHNDTSEPLNMTVRLGIFDGDKEVSPEMGLKEGTQQIKVNAKTSEVVEWPVETPLELGNFKVKAMVRAGKYKDGLEKDLPFLPSKTRLVFSDIAILNGNEEAKLILPPKIKPEEFKSVTLQIEPQLAVSLLNSLSQLYLSPMESTEQIINRFVPASIVAQLFEKHPKLKSALDSESKNNPAFSPWDPEDQRRITQMEETPWLIKSLETDSKSGSNSLINPRFVEEQKKSSWKRLAAIQLDDGGFPWIAGGKGDLYMTLYALDAFTTLRQHGVGITEEIERKAANFVLNNITKNKEVTEKNIALQLYCAYIFSHFLEEKWFPNGKTKVTQWLTSAESHAESMTPLGHGYSAWAWNAVGNTNNANLSLDRALESSQEDKMTGVYWAPESLSWLWFNDSIEKHAFFIRLLNTLKPKDPRLAGMVRWLLFNRKGNEWKSTRATAASIYSLVDFYDKSEWLKGVQTFQWRLTGKKRTLEVKNDEPLSQTLRWNAATPQLLVKPVSVTKKGAGIAYTSLTTLFATDDPREFKPSSEILVLSREFHKRIPKGNNFELIPLKEGETLSVGDQIEVSLKVQSGSQFEYIAIKSPRAAGFEPDSTTSGWQWDQISRYEEIRDSLENYYLPWVPQGDYTVRYRLRATTPGNFHFGPALVQSQYSPDVSAYTPGFEVAIK